MQKINKTQTVYLCCSLKQDGYNAQQLVFNSHYKYLYKIKLKKNSYGILLNSFGEECSSHLNEEECLIQMDSIEFCELLRNN